MPELPERPFVADSLEGEPPLSEPVGSAPANGRTAPAPAPRESLLRRKRKMIPDRFGDPMEAMGNLFDVAILIGVGFLIMALSSFGLNDIIGKGNVTIVKNPGAADMQVITRKDGEIKVLQNTDQTVQGEGAAIGIVYKLKDGSVVWSPSAPTTATP